MTIEGTHGTWGDLLRAGISPQEADFTVFGVPFDGLASARQGAAQAPASLRAWSRHLTPFSEDRTRLAGMSICDIGDFSVQRPELDFENIRARVAGLPNIPIALGGDHSISIPVLQGQRQRFAGKRLGLVWVDAHPDLCDEFDGSRLSHACVLRRALEAGIEQSDVCMIGLRSWEEQELDLVENGRLNIYSAEQVAERGMKWVANDVRRLLTRCDAIHISFDIDALDPSAAAGTGIPDFGGLTMREALILLKSLQGLKLVGLDVVEVAPPLDASNATVFAALKIIMEFIGLIAREKQLRGKR